MENTQGTGSCRQRTSGGRAVAASLFTCHCRAWPSAHGAGHSKQDSHGVRTRTVCALARQSAGSCPAAPLRRRRPVAIAQEALPPACMLACLRRVGCAGGRERERKKEKQMREFVRKPAWLITLTPDQSNAFMLDRLVDEDPSCFTSTPDSAANPSTPSCLCLCLFLGLRLHASAACACTCVSGWRAHKARRANPLGERMSASALAYLRARMIQCSQAWEPLRPWRRGRAEQRHARWQLARGRRATKRQLRTAIQEGSAG